ncbi:phosphomannomutase/phosphoglucomutase [Leeia aquatica]|uniref:Phosphomannomutase/phosphoglucomutase n=1 Tax=Leeia aquatica TaxID=2725557 RepID=A0A847S8Z4_9NEIS|nr:phosphomannomutase/phosphoglucomutase [Leeia aquatica]NLR75325.1 phosphomannomutase/phosphoglucomutase [Leeia aquatica]
MAKSGAEIFKAYDIRGIVGKSLTEERVRQIGHAIGSEARDRQVKTIVIGRDGRLSGPAFAEALSQGIRASGIHVIDIGQVATPVTYFAAHHLETGSAVMITGSHNPPEYNGLKMMLAGETLAGDTIQQLRLRIEENRLHQGEGSYQQQDVREAYLQRITSDIRLQRPLNIIVDAGNGVAGALAPVLYRRMGCRVRELFCEVDGQFPNHHPDPAKPENLADLIDALQKTDAEFGVAFDGDGDRLGVVTKSGQIIFPDRQMMVFAADILERHPGSQIIYDVKSTALLASWVKDLGGEPVMWRTGHSFMKAKLKELGAPLAGEMSGHIFFKERWYGFDDGIYAGARLLEILSRVDNPSALLEALPSQPSTPELHVDCGKEGAQHSLMASLTERARFHGAKDIVKIDGLRVEYPDGFGLVRASNTTPVLVLRFEGKDSKSLKRIQHDFRQALLTVHPELTLPF